MLLSPIPFCLTFFPLWKAEINPSSTIKALAKYYFVGLNDRLRCVHNDPVLVISSDLGRKSEPAICSPIRSEKFLLFLSTTADCKQRCCLGGKPGVCRHQNIRTLTLGHNAPSSREDQRGRTSPWLLAEESHDHMFMPVDSDWDLYTEVWVDLKE